MGDSSIEWTDYTWNPTRGCSRVSPGCENCYAERNGARGAREGGAYDGLIRLGGPQGPRWTGEVRLVPHKLSEPLRRREPRRIFVNSMSDLFHEKLSNEDIAAVFGVMAAAPQHTFQILTKRAERMREWFAWFRGEIGDAARAENILAEGFSDAVFDGTNEGHEAKTSEMLDRIRDAHDAHLDEMPWPLPNVWIGVSVEDQQRANERIPLLLQTPAAVRFISAEPLLGPVDLTNVKEALGERSSMTYSSLDKNGRDQWEDAGLDWVIVGGESGPGARPFDVAWARSIAWKCKLAGVPVFVKQLGAAPYDTADAARGQGKLAISNKKGGDMAEWPEDLRVREFPRTA